MRRPAARIAALTLALLGTGCANEVFETQLLVLADTEACMSLASSAIRVNAYRVLLVRLTEPPDPTDPRLPSEADLGAQHREWVDGIAALLELLDRVGFLGLEQLDQRLELVGRAAAAAAAPPSAAVARPATPRRTRSSRSATALTCRGSTRRTASSSYA